jgi:hypothetical protein
MDKQKHQAKPQQAKSAAKPEVKPAVRQEPQKGPAGIKKK